MHLRAASALEVIVNSGLSDLERVGFGSATCKLEIARETRSTEGIREGSGCDKSKRKIPIRAQCAAVLKAGHERCRGRRGENMAAMERWRKLRVVALDFEVHSKLSSRCKGA